MPGSMGNEDDCSSTNEKEKRLVIAMPKPTRVVADEEKQALQAELSPSSEESDEDLNEKFVDAEEPPLSLLDTPVPELPSIIVQQHPDPDLLPLPVRTSTPFATPPPSPPHSPAPRPLHVREVHTSTPVARPAWCVRAAEAPLLGLRPITPTRPVASSPRPEMRSLSATPVSRPDTPVLHVPGAFSSSDDEDDKNAMTSHPARSRAYRSPAPGLELDFAMQLRPGMCLGSDPAWLGRFLMAMFGWMTVFIGNSDIHSRQSRRAIA